MKGKNLAYQVRQIAFGALLHFDHRVESSEEQQAVDALVREILEPVRHDTVWKKVISRPSTGEFEATCVKAVAQDFRLTLQKERPNDYVSDRLGCHALVVARAELDLAILMAETDGHDCTQLREYQSSGSFHGLKLTRPEGSRAFCPLV